MLRCPLVRTKRTTLYYYSAYRGRTRNTGRGRAARSVHSFYKAVCIHTTPQRMDQMRPPHLLTMHTSVRRTEPPIRSCARTCAPDEAYAACTLLIISRPAQTLGPRRTQESRTLAAPQEEQLRGRTRGTARSPSRGRRRPREQRGAGRASIALSQARRRGERHRAHLVALRSITSLKPRGHGRRRFVLPNKAASGDDCALCCWQGPFRSGKARQHANRASRGQNQVLK